MKKMISLFSQVKQSYQQQISKKIFISNNFADLFAQYSKLTTRVNYSYSHVAQIFQRLIDIELNNKKIKKESFGQINNESLKKYHHFDVIKNHLVRDIDKIAEKELLMILKKISQSDLEFDLLLQAVLDFLHEQEQYKVLTEDGKVECLISLYKIKQLKPQYNSNSLEQLIKNLIEECRMFLDKSQMDLEKVEKLTKLIIHNNITDKDIIQIVTKLGHQFIKKMDTPTLLNYVQMSLINENVGLIHSSLEEFINKHLGSVQFRYLNLLFKKINESQKFIDPTFYEIIRDSIDEKVISIIKYHANKKKVIAKMDFILKYVFLRDFTFSNKLTPYLQVILEEVLYTKNDDYRIMYILIQSNQSISQKVQERFKRTNRMEIIDFRIFKSLVQYFKDEQIQIRLFNEFCVQLYYKSLQDIFDMILQSILFFNENYSQFLDIYINSLQKFLIGFNIIANDEFYESHYNPDQVEDIPDLLERQNKTKIQLIIQHIKIVNSLYKQSPMRIEHNKKLEQIYTLMIERLPLSMLQKEQILQLAEVRKDCLIGDLNVKIEGLFGKMKKLTKQQLIQLKNQADILQMNNSDFYNTSRDIRIEQESQLRIQNSLSFNRFPSDRQRLLQNRSVLNFSTMRDPRDKSTLSDRVNEEKVYIQGTNFNLEEVTHHMRQFILTYVPQNYSQDTEQYSYYMKKIKQIKETSIYYLVVSLEHIELYDKRFYLFVIKFPAEIIILFDDIIKQFLIDNFLDSYERETFDKFIRVRFSDLRNQVPMRKLQVEQLNTLISLKGIFIRQSAIIPEPLELYMKCSHTNCNYAMSVEIKRGRAEEPTKCPKCESKGSMEILYNMCSYSDKVYVTFQERADEIPEGETPINVNLVVYGDLIDECKPGDQIEVIGIYRAEPTRIKTRFNEFNSIFRTYIEVVSVVFLNENKVVLNNEFYSEKDQIVFDENEINGFKKMVNDPNFYKRLTDSFAPSLFGLEQTKMGLLCQLLGGTQKQFDTLQRGRFRNEINILLIGDPSTAKSQLLNFVNKITPRGIYTSGKGSSAVGLTAYISHDPDTKEIVLESGALVLSDNGICCIDEFDKMDEGTQSILHEVMEQQTISIAKRGIVCQLNARCAVLAAANPKESRYNPNKSIVYNLNLSPTLLSRFDLIYLMLDKAQEDDDLKLSSHILSLYANVNIKRTEESINKNLIPRQQLTRFISYAREYIHPRITDEAEMEIIKGYLEMRNLGSSRKVVTATPRQIESIIRLSEARAKMRLDDQVRKEDVLNSIDLIRVATQTAAIDPSTGQIDMNYLATGFSSISKQQIESIKKCIWKIMELQEEIFRVGYPGKQLFNELCEQNSEIVDLNPQLQIQALKELEEERVVQILGDREHEEKMSYFVKKIMVDQFIQN